MLFDFLHTQLQVVNGHPAISFYDQSDAAFWYVRAEDSMGESWGSPVLVDEDEHWASVAPGCNELMVVNGRLALAYYAGLGEHCAELRYTRANDADGSSWGEPIV